MWISLINRVYKLPYKLIIDITKTSVTIKLRHCHCSVQGPTQKMENSNVDTMASLSEENRKIIVLERQLLEHKHKLEMTVLKHNDEIRMLKLQHALNMLQVEQSFTNWEAMRHINAINIRSFIYEFEFKRFTEFGHLKTRREKYSALAKKKHSHFKKILHNGRFVC